MSGIGGVGTGGVRTSGAGGVEGVQTQAPPAPEEAHGDGAPGATRTQRPSSAALGAGTIADRLAAELAAREAQGAAPVAAPAPAAQPVTADDIAGLRGKTGDALTRDATALMQRLAKMPAGPERRDLSIELGLTLGKVACDRIFQGGGPAVGQVGTHVKAGAAVAGDAIDKREIGKRQRGSIADEYGAPTFEHFKDVLSKNGASMSSQDFARLHSRLMGHVQVAAAAQLAMAEVSGTDGAWITSGESKDIASMVAGSTQVSFYRQVFQMLHQSGKLNDVLAAAAKDPKAKERMNDALRFAGPEFQAFMRK